MLQSKMNPLISSDKSTFIFRQIYSSCAVFVSSVQKIVIKFSTKVSKQTARGRRPGFCKHKQNEI